MSIRRSLVLLAAACVSACALAGSRLTTHYRTITGYSGIGLWNSETDNFFLDKDLVDFADGDWGDETLSIKGMPDGLYFDKTQKIPGYGMPWYESDDAYHPLLGSVSKVGSYDVTFTASWPDGVTESVVVTIVIKPASAPDGSARLTTHYTEIKGTVGVALTNPETGTPYLDKDLCDFADGDWGDEDVSVSGLPPGLSFDKSQKIAGVGKPWYDASDKYHPLAGTPSKAGTYTCTIFASWSDGHSEEVTIRFVISDGSGAGTSDASLVNSLFGKAQSVNEAIWRDDEVVGMLVVKIGKANKKTQAVKVSAVAYMLDGSKISSLKTLGTVKTQSWKGSSWAEVADLHLAFKGDLPELVINVSRSSGDETPVLWGSSQGTGTTYWLDKCCEGPSDTLESGARFHLEKFNFSSPYPDFAVNKAKLPEGLEVSLAGTKLVCPKSDCALRLTYKAKTQTFKGKFKVFLEQEVPGGKAKVKKVSITVTGVIYDGVGYGLATEKKLGSWPVRIAR